MKVLLQLSTAGLGIIFYSPFAVKGIAEGENYLKVHFTDPKDVADHVMGCRLSAFCTGTGGDFELLIQDEGFDFGAADAAEITIRLGLEVRGREVWFRDLYDLMNWSASCPPEQRIKLADGFYRITAFTSRPPSGVFGDHQRITLYFEPVPQKPDLYWLGVPSLCP